MDGTKERTGTGKWRQAGVPHRGWTCVDIIDGVEEDSEFSTCEMCEVALIRYQHVMEHPDYDETLHVGCICAGHMTEDYIGARHREKEFKATIARRNRWLTREWRISRKGNEYLNVDGFNVVVFPQREYWGVRVTNRANDDHQFSRLLYRSQDAAKRAAFTIMLEMTKQQQQPKSQRPIESFYTRWSDESLYE
jgi:hypothetical protein